MTKLGVCRKQLWIHTGTLSHELLHLVLEEQGQKKSCYVDRVHENQFEYELKEIGKNVRPAIKKFNCWDT